VILLDVGMQAVLAALRPIAMDVEVMWSVPANRSLVWPALTSWVRKVRISGSGAALSVSDIRGVSVAMVILPFRQSSFQ